MIVEDIGPLPIDRPSWELFFSGVLPLGVITIISGTYSVLTGINLWRAHHCSTGSLTPPSTNLVSLPIYSPEHSPYRSLSTAQSIKYAVLAAVNIIGLLFGFLWAAVPWLNVEEMAAHYDSPRWNTLFDIRDNMKQLHLVFAVPRGEIEGWLNFTGFLYSIPANGLLFFLLFGLHSGAFGIYCLWFQSLRQKSSNGTSSFRRYGTKIPWRVENSLGRTGMDHVVPSQLDAIALESFPPPVQMRMKATTSKGYPLDHSALAHLPSPTSSHRATVHRSSPTSPLERSRTFGKSPNISLLSPAVSRSSTIDDSPREASSSRGGPGGGGELPAGHGNPTGGPSSRGHGRLKDIEQPPPYEPAAGMMVYSPNQFISDAAWQRSIP
ncbi:hypothetical protein FRC17_010872 [Serendipita sp. 399]|nr:hypothetical protein FRC17_010872 [Serendipita sp. 399]